MGKQESQRLRNKEDWIAWDGGDCPVKPKTRVAVQTREGAEMEGEARFFRWLRVTAFEPRSDIVKYRHLKIAPIDQARSVVGRGKIV